MESHTIQPKVQWFFLELLTVCLYVLLTTSAHGDETKSVTIKKGSSTKTTTFSGTKTNQRGYVRKLVVQTQDGGKIKTARIKTNAEDAAWRKDSSVTESSKAGFKGVQNAPAATTSSKEYAPEFDGTAVVKGTGPGTEDIYIPEPF